MTSQRDTALPHDWPKHTLIYSSLTDLIPVHPSPTFPPPNSAAARHTRRAPWRPQATRDHPSSRPPGRAARGCPCAGSSAVGASTNQRTPNARRQERMSRPHDRDVPPPTPLAGLEAGDTTVTALLAAPALSDSGSSVPPRVSAASCICLRGPWDVVPRLACRRAGLGDLLSHDNARHSFCRAFCRAGPRTHVHAGHLASCFSLCTRVTTEGAQDTSLESSIYALVVSSSQALLDGWLHRRFVTREQELAGRSAVSSLSVYRRTSAGIRRK